MLKQSISMILKFLLDTQMMWMIFIKILKNRIQIRNVKYCFSWYDCWLLSIKKLNPIVTELFIRGRKLKISIVFITQSYFAVPKNIWLNSTHFIMKIPNKQGIQQIAFNHSSDIDFQDFMDLYKKCTAKSYSFLVVVANLASDNPSSFTKNLLKRI